MSDNFDGEAECADDGLKGTNQLAVMWASMTRNAFDSFDALAEAQREQIERAFNAGVMLGICFAMQSDTLDRETMKRMERALGEDARGALAKLHASRPASERNVERPVLHRRPGR